MSFLAFIIGMGIAGTVGWCALTLLEWKTPVLGRAEKIAWSAIVGSTLLTFFFFLLYTTDVLLLTRTALLTASVILLGALWFALWKFGCLHTACDPQWNTDTHLPHNKWLRIGLFVLIGWTAVKILAGSVDALTTPTYWDDAFNNWNMRAKVFAETHEIALELPGGNDITITKEGVNSYPPSVPLLKAWLVILRGNWSEGLANSIHVVWYIALLTCFFFFLRRAMGSTMSIIGTCALASLPLVLIQGLNPYADIYVAGHLLIGLGALWRAASEHTASRIRVWLTLSAFTMAIAVFTKNEVLLIFMPVYALLFLWTVIRHVRLHHLSKIMTIRFVMMIALLAIVLIAPWLWFKVANGLTFGNAKSVSDLTVGITDQTYIAFYSIRFFLTREANFLFLPLAFLLVLLFGGKKSWTAPLHILALFVLIAFAEQSCIYMFTPLSTEAINQTGLGRGLVQLAPIAMLFTWIRGTQLWHDAK